jgi:hypothetical protein
MPASNKLAAAQGYLAQTTTGLPVPPSQVAPDDHKLVSGAHRIVLVTDHPKNGAGARRTCRAGLALRARSASRTSGPDRPDRRLGCDRDVRGTASV